MSDVAIRRLVIALSLSLVVATVVAGLLTLSQVRAGLSPVVVMTLATVIVVWPLVTQAVFVVMQGVRREVAPRFGKGNDGWLIVVLLSVFPSAFGDSLAALAHPAIQGLGSTPAVSTRLAVFLVAGRVVSMRLRPWHGSKRAESAAPDP